MLLLLDFDYETILQRAPTQSDHMQSKSRNVPNCKASVPFITASDTYSLRIDSVICFNVNDTVSFRAVALSNRKWDEHRVKICAHSFNRSFSFLRYHLCTITVHNKYRMRHIAVNVIVVAFNAIAHFQLHFLNSKWRILLSMLLWP